MYRYYIHDERGFVNEFTLAVADNDEDAAALEHANYRRTTRARWIYALRLRYDRAAFLAPLPPDRDYPARYDGYLSSNIGQVISDCARATHDFLNGGEWEREQLNRRWWEH